ncbi:MAG TPA: carbohydrate kinase family protein [Usitatibacteraceae bacterium]|nr:carbohydrate kinase family protein [Usitatibacteraceae bacterium]
MSILVCGSIAYDTIMVFRDQFKNHILPDQIHILNVAFLVPDLRREYGGCAGNIAYSLRLLGEDPFIMATVGHDADPYELRLDRLGLSRKHVKRVPEHFTAQAFITTDVDDNQITAFHPGAMSDSHANRIAETSGVTLAIVSPDGRQGMLEHAGDLAAAGIPYVLDPGQGLPMFSGDDLRGMLAGAKCLTVNDYEARLVEQKMGVPLSRVAESVEAVIVTRGAEGADVMAGGQQIRVPAVKPESLVDPTGCGDAFRAGLLHGLERGFGWVKAVRLGSLMGSIKIAHRGGQNHKPSRGEIERRYLEAFGEAL